MRVATNQKQNSQRLRLYWTFKDNLTVIDNILMTGRQIIIPKELEKQLHSNHLGIEKWGF